jgi:hypothetical protein
MAKLLSHEIFAYLISKYPRRNKLDMMLTLEEVISLYNALPEPQKRARKPVEVKPDENVTPMF